jgi:hypothetical protein
MTTNLRDDDGFDWAYLVGERPDRWVDPQRRISKRESPYGYSEFFHWGGHGTTSGCEAVYSDRLWQWDYKKMKALCDALGKRFEQCSQSELSEFLSSYWGKPVVATALAEGCNISNGYPYFIMWYRGTEEGK